MRARNRFFSLILACGVGSLLVGCRDAAAPSEGGQAAHAQLVSNTGGSVLATTVFVYDPMIPATYSLPGQHRISFSVGAVCDPATSSYGPTEWDQPCQPLLAPISITATTSLTPQGHPRVDFSPALRFVPGREVTLYLRDSDAALDPTTVIQWCDDAGQCADEGTVQASTETKRDAALGIVFRAIKHFSGYLISAGRASADL
jgi:hypothetical protein